MCIYNANIVLAKDLARKLIVNIQFNLLILRQFLATLILKSDFFVVRRYFSTLLLKCSFGNNIRASNSMGSKLFARINSRRQNLPLAGRVNIFIDCVKCSDIMTDNADQDQAAPSSKEIIKEAFTLLIWDC